MVNRVVLDPTPSTSVGIFTKPVSTAAIPPVGNQVDGPTGHRSPIRNRANVLGIVFTQTHSPDKGMLDSLPKSLPRTNSHPQLDLKFGRTESHMFGDGSNSFPSTPNTGRMPKLNFPKFDGENPRLWIKRSQDYFELCQVESRAWIKIASMYFTKSAARWLQSVEKKIRTVTWFEFCQMILDRFGKEHHELLIRQLFHIKQLSSVAEYVERFSELVDQLTAYESRTDPLYYTMRFLDGLKYELQSAVLMQRPPDLDTACVLSLLQEEMTAPDKKEGVLQDRISSKL
jgi:hypothetical protein